jgi:outer membrane phospholipase A
MATQAPSRSFRETGYEPEAILAFDSHCEVLGWQGRLLGIGVNHQSNGRSNPLSRVGIVSLPASAWSASAGSGGSSCLQCG